MRQFTPSVGFSLLNFFSLLMIGNLNAQSYPVPFDLSSGTFYFNSWDSLV